MNAWPIEPKQNRVVTITTVSRPCWRNKCQWLCRIYFCVLRSALQIRFMTFNHQRFQACKYSNLDWLIHAECVLITNYADRWGKYVVGRRHSSSTDNSCHPSTCCPCYMLGRSAAQFPPFFSSSIETTLVCYTAVFSVATQRFSRSAA